MKLSILQEKLKKGLNLIERIPGKSLSLPILENVLIKTEKNFLTLEATDLEIGIKWWSLAKIEKEGKVVVPIKVLSNFINFLPNKIINMEIKDENLYIDCKNYKTKIKGFNPEDFPIIPQINKEKFFSINSRFLCQGLTQLVNIITFSTIKPEISGVYFLFQKNLIKMVATDIFRLGEKKLFLDQPIDLPQEYSFIVPQKTINELINILEEKEVEFKIYFSPNQVLFESLMTETAHPQVHLVSRLIDGEYPNYQEIIPKKYKTQVILEKNEFLNQIKLASFFSEKTNEIKFKIDPKKNKVEIFSQNQNFGEHYSFLLGKTQGKPLEISFNHRFLLDGILNIKSSEIIFELNDEGGPGVLKPVGDSNYIYIVMPIKLP